jgi:carbon monoxide dehydrogenase subunit G
MTSTQEALVRRPFGDVQQQLHDLDWVLAALPGTTLSRDADAASGSVRLKLDGQQITYRVTIRGAGPDDTNHAVTVAVSGKEARGGGILAATVQIELHDVEGDPGSTLLRAVLDVTATGRGESVSEAGWGRAAETLLAGVVDALSEAAAPATPAAEPAAPAAPAAPSAPDDAITPAPMPERQTVPLAATPLRPVGPIGSAAPARRSAGAPPYLLAGIAAVAAMILLVLRRRGRRRSA